MGEEVLSEKRREEREKKGEEIQIVDFKKKKKSRTKAWRGKKPSSSGRRTILEEGVRSRVPTAGKPERGSQQREGETSITCSRKKKKGVPKRQKKKK